MNYKIGIITFTLVFAHLISFSQIDKDKIEIIAKTAIFWNLPFNQAKEENLQKFISLKIKTRKVESFGFKPSLIFIEVDSISKYTLKINISDGDCNIPYLIAVDTLDGSFFRIQGFH